MNHNNGAALSEEEAEISKKVKNNLQAVTENKIVPTKVTKDYKDQNNKSKGSDGKIHVVNCEAQTESTASQSELQVQSYSNSRAPRDVLGDTTKQKSAEPTAEVRKDFDVGGMQQVSEERPQSSTSAKTYSIPGTPEKKRKISSLSQTQNTERSESTTNVSPKKASANRKVSGSSVSNADPVTPQNWAFSLRSYQGSPPSPYKRSTRTSSTEPVLLKGKNGV